MVGLILAQDAMLHECQSINNRKILEDGAIFQAMKSFTLEVIEFSVLLFLLFSRAMFLLVVGTRCSMMSSIIPLLLLRRSRLRLMRRLMIVLLVTRSWTLLILSNPLRKKAATAVFFYIGKSSLLLMRALDYNSEGVDALTMFRVGENFK